jgi:hypothetical protein
VLVTLVGQGITFAPLLRGLGLRSDAHEPIWRRAEAQAAAFSAAIERLDKLSDEDPGIAASAARYRRTLEGQRDRLRAHLDAEDDDRERGASPDRSATIAVRRAVLEAQREELVRWRDAGRLADSVRGRSDGRQPRKNVLRRESAGDEASPRRPENDRDDFRATPLPPRVGARSSGNRRAQRKDLDVGVQPDPIRPTDAGWE